MSYSARDSARMGSGRPMDSPSLRGAAEQQAPMTPQIESQSAFGFVSKAKQTTFFFTFFFLSFSKKN